MLHDFDGVVLNDPHVTDRIVVYSIQATTNTRFVDLDAQVTAFRIVRSHGYQGFATAKSDFQFQALKITANSGQVHAR